MKLTSEYLIGWIDNFKKSWMEKDLDEIANIFSKIENYFESEDLPPAKSVEEVMKFWREIKGQDIKKLDFKIISIKDNTCEVGWFFEDQTGKCDGVYQIKFDEDLNCIEFRQ